MAKTAVITGATSGLGLSYAKYYARQGLDLMITGRRREILLQNAQELQNQSHVTVQPFIGDLSSPYGVDSLAGLLRGRQIDVLVNNAGFGLKPTFAETPEDDVEKMMVLQIGCVTKLTHIVLQGMLQRGSGVIINISSDGAFAVMPHNVVYSSTKLYIVNFTEGLHMELAGTGVQVQAVCPGFIDSHFHEAAGMRMDKNRKGLFAFRHPDDIVADAMKDLQKGRVVSVPDAGAKMMKTFVRFLPRRLFYKSAVSFSKRFTGKGKA